MKNFNSQTLLEGSFHWLQKEIDMIQFNGQVKSHAYFNEGR